MRTNYYDKRELKLATKYASKQRKNTAPSAKQELLERIRKAVSGNGSRPVGV